MSSQGTDLTSILTALSTAVGQFNSNPNVALAQQIAMLLQQWVAADPGMTNNGQSFQGVLDALRSGHLEQLQSAVQSALPNLTGMMNLLTQTAQASGQPIGQVTFSQAPAGTPQSVTGANGSTLSFSTASQIIDSALSLVGIDPNSLATSGVNVGQSLTTYFWNQIVTQGITDETTIGEMITALLPSTGQFETAYPGYQKALAAGYVRTPADYVTAEEGITAVMLQGGIPKDLINPVSIGNLIAGGVSVNEVADRVNNGFDQVLNSPAEVQNYFAQEFGAQGPRALATVFLNPGIDDVTLKKMLAGTEIRGALAAANLTVSQGLSQRLADEGQTYQSALQAAKTLTQQRGLFEQTVGEQQSQQPVPGTLNANRPLDINDQGVEALLGTNAADAQQVHQDALARANEFRGGGGASTTQAEGFSGMAEAKPF